jgi:SAM-dependent methyltransferase
MSRSTPARRVPSGRGLRGRRPLAATSVAGHPAKPTGGLAPYTRYAALYDRLGQSQWSEQLARFTLDTLLPRFERHPRRALDLACGTGTAALLLARAGLVVTGLDGSPQMLAVARAKAEAAGLAVEFVVGNLCADWRATIPGPFDLVTCCYDSLNYLLEPAQLRRAFTTGRLALAPRGLLVCDLATASAYRGAEESQVWSLELDAVSYSVATAWDEETRLATTLISCTSHSRDDDTAFCEPHVQRSYERAEVEAALDAAGLRLLAVYGAAPLRPPAEPPGPQAPRLIYVAEPELP